MSIDGYVAGSNMTEEKPFGDMPTNLLHRWMFEESDKHRAEINHLNATAGAYIMGRNMYGPKGESYDETWRGWWGDNPPYHAPVFVLTHKPRKQIEMQGGTTFTFVTDGIHSALEKAQFAAGEKPVAIAGGANVVNQYLAAGLIDELWLHIAPVTVGSGQRLFEGVPKLRMEVISTGGSELVSHIRYRILNNNA